MENNKRIDSKTNLGILMLAIGMFVVGTVELVFAGVLKLISVDLGVSVATAGQLVTIYAVIYAIGTPILITLTSRIERKKLLLLSLFVFILSNVIAAISPNYIFLMISRIIAAISAGIFSVSSIAFAAKLVPPAKAGKAIGTTVMGFSFFIGFRGTFRDSCRRNIRMENDVHFCGACYSSSCARNLAIYSKGKRRGTSIAKNTVFYLTETRNGNGAVGECVNIYRPIFSVYVFHAFSA